MEIKLVVWHNGDPSVGINGESFEVTLKVEPTPYFALGENESDTAECIADFTKSLKKLVEDNMDYLDCDFKMKIATPAELKQEWEEEKQMWAEQDVLFKQFAKK